MEWNFFEWLNYLLRWAHLISVISWIGSSLYFMWLDSSLVAPLVPKKGVKGELWMVHSGGFYRVEKCNLSFSEGSSEMPAQLHWFKWEAMLSLLTGLSLLFVVYYLGDGLVKDEFRWGHVAGVCLAVGLMGAAWVVYDQLWISALAKKPGVLLILCCALLLGIIFSYSLFLNGRAVFLHVGALVGTLMVLNVWMRILPFQKQMVQATAEGREVDLELGERAKNRSVHNSFLTLGVLFMMLSNRYPSMYGSSYLVWICFLLFVLGGTARYLMMKGFLSAVAWVLVAVQLGFLVALTSASG